MQRDTGKQKTKTELGRYVMAGASFAALSLNDRKTRYCRSNM